MTSRNPSQDRIAVIGVGTTGYARRALSRSRTSLVLEACVAAIQDAGVSRHDIDGVVGVDPAARTVINALGLEGVTHHANHPPPFGFAVIDAMNAVLAGSCQVALVFASAYRTPDVSRAAARDPYRRGLSDLHAKAARTSSEPESLEGAVGYAAWAARFLHESRAGREHLAYVAINARTNAGANELAAKRDPLSIDDYMHAPMIYEPLCLLDMDVPADGADAVVLTTADGAASQAGGRAVFIHAAASGVTAPTDEDQMVDLDRHGQHVVAAALRDRSELWLDDVDVFLPYDGFTFITLAWLESLGWCRTGEAGALVDASWDPTTQRLLLRGSVPINTHGGSLSEGASRGSGHFREAVMQLRGQAGPRQVSGARVALVALGGMFFNAQGFILRRRSVTGER